MAEPVGAIKNRIEKITAMVEDDKISQALTIADAKSLTSKPIRSAIMESFEKEYIGITADVLTLKVKDQLTKLEDIQFNLYEKIKTGNYTKNIAIFVAISKVYKEWLQLIFQLRGDLQEAKLQVAQQFIFKDKEQRQDFTNFVLEASRGMDNIGDMILVEEDKVIEYAN